MSAIAGGRTSLVGCILGVQQRDRLHGEPVRDALLDLRQDRKIDGKLREGRMAGVPPVPGGLLLVRVAGSRRVVPDAVEQHAPDTLKYLDHHVLTALPHATMIGQTRTAGRSSARPCADRSERNRRRRLSPNAERFPKLIIQQRSASPPKQ